MSKRYKESIKNGVSYRVESVNGYHCYNLLCSVVPLVNP